MGRSGTTLVERLLTNHTDIDILSQPFPLIFVYFKKFFMESLGHDEYYVLNDHVHEYKYTKDQFEKYLSSISIKEEFLSKVFIEMKSYSGQSIKPKSLNKLKLLENLIGFKEIYERALDCYEVKNKTYIGSKEIMCEEFLTYFTNNGTKSIVIVRDPMDVLASPNYPRHKKYLGEKKPTLFILRTWKKSVKHINQLKNNKNFCFIRYEDLVCEPYKSLDKITNFLNLPAFKEHFFDDGIFNRDGSMWQANSSFNKSSNFISNKSINVFEKILSNQEINYVESICQSEMEVLRYQFNTTPNQEIIKNFRDYDIENSQHIAKNFSSLDNNIKKETEEYISKNGKS